MLDDEIITNLDEVKRLAKQSHDEFEVLKYQLRLINRVSDDEIDAFVESVAGPVIEAVDCLECANCCRSLDVYLTEKDVSRIANGTHISLDSIRSNIDHASAREVGEWGKFACSPCKYLDEKHCTIYEHRPQSCRIYPALTPDFRWLLNDMIEGAASCPIIFNVLRRMTYRIDELYR